MRKLLILGFIFLCTSALGSAPAFTNTAPVNGAKQLARMATLSIDTTVVGTTYTFYLDAGDGSSSPTTSLGDQATTSVATSLLSAATQYAWYATAENTTGTTTGSVWTFWTVSSTDLGTVVLTESVGPKYLKYTWSLTSEANGYAMLNGTKTIEGKLVGVNIKMDAVATPTAAWDLTITNKYGADCLAAGGANLSTATLGVFQVPFFSTYGYMALSGPVNINGSNMGASKKVQIELLVEP